MDSMRRDLDSRVCHRAYRCATRFARLSNRDPTYIDEVRESPISKREKFEKKGTLYIHSKSKNKIHQIRCLHWQCSQTDESFRIFCDSLCNIVVQILCQIVRVRRLCPVAEHHWHRRQHLYIDVITITVGNSRL